MISPRLDRLQIAVFLTLVLSSTPGC